MLEIAAVLAGYVLGSLPFGYWLPLLLRGEDIRTQGSGNVGATNVFRVYGRGLGLPVALLDVAKGFAAASLGLWAGGAIVGVLAAAAAMVGHAYPVFLRFRKGGKMVATAGGATFALAPLAAFSCVGVWLAIFLVTRYASLASIATAVGFIALVGVAAEFGVVMLIYLKHAWEARLSAGRAPTPELLDEAIREGAVLRIRPKAMTVAVIVAGLLPILWSHGTGSEVMQRIAAPMVGGMITAPLLSMFVIPAAYLILRRRDLRRSRPATTGLPAAAE